jgi:hypothetical protein
MDIKIELEKIAGDIQDLFKSEIRTQGLVDSGKLLNSVKVKVISTYQGYNLQVITEDYFQFLDKKYKISDNVYKSSGFKKQLKRLEVVFGKYVTEELTNLN